MPKKSIDESRGGAALNFFTNSEFIEVAGKILKKRQKLKVPILDES